jgi:hypothetical protein
MPIISRYVFFIALATANCLLADCNNAIHRTTPDQAFTLHDDGTVTHNTTGLMWMRCPVGQTWNGSTCGGKLYGYTWKIALQIAEEFSFAGYNDWRLPNKNELASIVERACQDPAINTAVFPNKDVSYVWSSSPNFGQAWSVDFGEGFVTPYAKYVGSYVFLVRGG